MGKYIITYGGWYQRTTLHLSEIHGFLAHGYTKLKLSKEKLDMLRAELDLSEVTRETGLFEYVKATSKDGIEIRYFEDGLYLLQLKSDDITKAQQVLSDYFENNFNPAINYLFSLGAPTPKILANMEISHPNVIGVISPDPQKFQIDKDQFGVVYSQLSSKNITVYKTTEHVFIVTKEKHSGEVQAIIEMQIFFREFKDQLERYLDIHRLIWEEISDISERKYIKGWEIEKSGIKLDEYEKTIDLIDSRINQMDNYVRTRASIAKSLKIEDELATLFQFKFETLIDTHAYIQDLWKMTKNYLGTAVATIRDIQNKSLNNSIRSLQLLTSIGVIAGIVGYITKESIPNITSVGVIYLALLLAIAYLLNFLVSFIYKELKYKINFPEEHFKI